ncbi:MAG: DUF4338 domain-containing protein [Desulfuromonadales bacterium]|nr:DUF4338 domain-containing protein [Desulfuromonadales bacterium]
MAEGVAAELIHVGRVIRAADVALIRETVELLPGLSRLELAKTLCEHLAWYTASGTYRTDACLGLLERLESRGLLRLPEKKAAAARRRSRRAVGSEAAAPGAAIRGPLEALGGVELRVVEGRGETECWNQSVARYHYLGYTPPAGYRLRYFVECAQGRLGCVLLAGAARALAARDAWIGWTRRQRLANLAWVVNNTRFLVFPWVAVEHLASQIQILGHLARRVAEDWYARWGYRPVLLETFVDPARYRGTCYRASGWERIGQTTGQGLVRPGRSYQSSVKDIYVRPLAEDFREQLCTEGLVGRRLES